MMQGPDLIQTFDAELRRSAEQIQTRLMELEAGQGSTAESLQEAYRLTHSVKGAARVVGLAPIEDLAHALEDRLQELVRTGAPPPGPEISVFLRVVDGFVAGLDAFLQGLEFDAAPLLAEFRAACAGGASLPAPSPAARETEIPSDVPTAPVPAVRRDEFLTVATSGVDELFRRLEEAFLIESRLTTVTTSLADDDLGPAQREAMVAGVRRDTSRLHQVLLQFHEIVRGFRMEPLERLRVTLQRAVRDVAETLGKPVAFRVQNAGQMVDTALLDALLEPLLHLVRNAVDHGLERPGEREAKGKPREGVVELEGRMRGSTLELRVRDDGRGLSVEGLKRKALEGGFASAEQSAAWTDAQWLALPFRPGFSTAATVTTFSGRGMGLDIVRDRIRSLGGDVHLTTSPGRGTTVEIRVPVRLLTARTLLVRCGERLAGIPMADVERVVSFRPDDVETVAGKAYVRWGGLPVAVEPLASHLGWSAPPGTSSQLVIVSRHGTLRGLVVDEVRGEIEQPAMPAPWNLRSLGYVAGLIVLGDGGLVPLLELRELLHDDALAAEADPVTIVQPAAAAPAERRVVLVVDDSATIRALHRSVLSGEGYEVLTADDGAEALALMHRRAVDLVISDIQMPRMDGLTLIRRIRVVPAWQRLPIIVVSQYGRRDDLQKAASAGADRYLVKSSFQPTQLVGMVAELVA